MRRLLSISMVLFLGLSPLIGTLEASDESRLPACCRTHGAHHCAMTPRMAAMLVEAESGSTPMLTAPTTCPLFPCFLAGPSTPAPALVTSVAGLPVLLVQAHVFAADQADVRMEPIGILAGRGPPASTPS